MVGQDFQDTWNSEVSKRSGKGGPKPFVTLCGQAETIMSWVFQLLRYTNSPLNNFFFFWVCVFTSGPGSFAWVSLDWLWKPKLRKISDIIFQSLPQTRACFLTSQKVERSSLAISWILFCYSGRTRLAAFSKISTYPERETSGLDFPRASKGQTENQGI